MLLVVTAVHLFFLNFAFCIIALWVATQSLWPGPAFTSGFLNLGTLDTGGRIIIWGVVLVYYSQLSCIPSLYPLDARSTFPVVTTKTVSRHCQMPSKVNYHHHWQQQWWASSCASEVPTDTRIPRTGVSSHHTVMDTQTELSVPKRLFAVESQGIEIGRYCKQFLLFSVPLIFGLSPSNKDHHLKDTKQHLVLFSMISVYWQMSLLWLTHLMSAISFCLLVGFMHWLPILAPKYSIF